MAKPDKGGVPNPRNRVLVIGLRSEQTRKLIDQFKDVFEIDALGDQERHDPKRLTNLEAYRRIIVCTKFTNHKTHTHCKKFSSYQMVAGGFSSVKSLLGAMA